MKNLALILASVLVFGVSMSAMADDHGNGNGNGNSQSNAKHDIKVGISSHSLVGVSSASTITLEPAAPEVAGAGLDFSASSASDNSVWLNYSSILKGKSSNSISVSMVGDELPKGVDIELVAAEDAGKGKGEVGKTSSKKTIVLSNKSLPVVSEIKNCYTGTGSGSGHQLTYALKMNNEGDNYKELTSGDFTTTITYTITDK